MPTQPKSPGHDYSPALRGKRIEWDNAIFYEMETVRAIRDDNWKYVARHPNGPNELYDMKRDPQERVNLFGQAENSAKQAEMARRLDDFFSTYADPQYDIWHGGRSKAKRHTQ
jgi:arylsulfatase A-like enzyme